MEGKFIQIWRKKESTPESSTFRQLLLSNSTHEARTPLNAIINYIELALEGNLNVRTREILKKAHHKSKSLIYAINDLLDLSKTNDLQNSHDDIIFDLHKCIQDATETFKADAKRKDLEFKVEIHALPQFVSGNHRYTRHTICILLANAFAHTEKGQIKIDIVSIEVTQSLARIEFIVTDTGVGMDEKQVESLIQALKQVGKNGVDEGLSEGQPTSLGLAFVSRVIRKMGGQLRLKSQVGQGCRFAVWLHFTLPEAPPEEQQEYAIMSQSFESEAVLETGEVILMAHQLRRSGRRHLRDRSVASSGNRSGSQSSHGSDADRLINVIQMPLRHEDHTLEGAES